MRLWTLHPRYLDRQGLVAVWREGLLAQAVLRGNTKGYKNHPQLLRFKKHNKPLQAIGFYLLEVVKEAKLRGYKFDVSKVDSEGYSQPIQTTSGQLEFEIIHLLHKLLNRSKKEYDFLSRIDQVDPHPLFQVIPGEVEVWEKGSPGRLESQP